MIKISAQLHKKYPSTLYALVFESVLVKYAVLFLFAFLLLQPVAAAYAFEDTATTAAPEESEGEELPEQAEQADTVLEEGTDPALSTGAADASDESEPPQDLYVSEEDAVEAAGDTVQEVSSESATTSQTASTTPAEEEDISDLVQTGNTEDTVADAEANDDALELSEYISEVPADDVQESEFVEPETEEETVLVVDHKTSQLQFDTKECASVGDGSFYCSTVKAENAFGDDGVFAAPDAQGDLEIFIRVDGVDKQLTSNSVDDSAPYYDALSDRIVWHTNHEDRYQIVSFDMESSEETVLTDAAYNNMEPVAYGDITMWQAWINNNWEIMYFDGTDQKQLTDNSVHDVSPSIRGGYTVWQSQLEDGWQVAVYDQKTSHIEYVRSEGGAHVENPRFVLVYDSTNDAGDVQTLGYDFDNKRSFTFNSIPADLPDKLPEPDQTGETRALIQNKQSVRGIEVKDSEPVPTGTGTSTATSTVENELPSLDLTAASSTASSSADTIVAEIEDIVIPVAAASSEMQEISHIPDVLIPPLEATSTAEVR